MGEYPNKKATLETVQIEGELFYKIHHSDSLRPFFISIVSDTNHWMFISSNGGLTAGRKNSEYALFPYYTDDKITESAEITGSKTIIALNREGERKLWEPFSDTYRGVYRYTRNLYKSEAGNSILFEEINHDLELCFRYRWSSSALHGFVRRSELINQGSWVAEIELIDGIQNILPYGVPSGLQNTSSNLVDAYKKSEIMAESCLGIYSLSAIIVDKAEPSEALKANVAWIAGLDRPLQLASSLQLDTFRNGYKPVPETDIRGERGAYFAYAQLSLDPGSSRDWFLVANVNQGPAAVADLHERLKSDPSIREEVLRDVQRGTQALNKLVASADGLQCSADERRNSRHFSNVMFNIMRGGIFDQGYTIEYKDFVEYLGNANRAVFTSYRAALEVLPDVFPLERLLELAKGLEDSDLVRLCEEYLPLKFSRRHGDPSRPWNKFSINTQNEEDGSKVLDYEGNWRDIFQNWEALAYSYPRFIEGMIHKFVNATTFDGYNPYRVTKGGFDWEVIDPQDPWSYIGYWGDHQIIYLLKFLEFAENYYPSTLGNYMRLEQFVYAAVPYRIKEYEAIVSDPKDTIVFDEDWDHRIRSRREEIGADGALLQDPSGDIYRVNFTEKILTTLLAKCSNLVPEGGIWMNTQRPEWNDANNALVGNGLSMVTLYYLRRFIAFWVDRLTEMAETQVRVSTELLEYFRLSHLVLQRFQQLTDGSMNDRSRREFMDELGRAASDYRKRIYEHGFSGQKDELELRELLAFSELALRFLDRSIELNRRGDGLYHAYNILTLEPGQARISPLSEMLEGQVAVLSSGYLSPEQALEVLDQLKASNLFREDQYSYTLYPNKELPRFMEKNNLPQGAEEQIGLLRELLADGNRDIVVRDGRGVVHFNGNFNNAGSVKAALDRLPEERYGERLANDRQAVLDLFEQVFHHKAFTGRSGTFFGYEGLGSIYWHMVSKLLLATQECCHRSYREKGQDEVTGRLIDHYYEILAGIGAHKSPELYGAFPTDPYSHTPAHRGAQQPGMTGQVKEDIIARFGELGVFVENGRLRFVPYLMDRQELLGTARAFRYIDQEQKEREVTLEPGSLGFTLCQVPVIYRFGQQDCIDLWLSGGEQLRIEGSELSEELSRRVFARAGIERIEVGFSEDLQN